MSYATISEWQTAVLAFFEAENEDEGRRPFTRNIAAAEELTFEDYEEISYALLEEAIRPVESTAGTDDNPPGGYYEDDVLEWFRSTRMARELFGAGIRLFGKGDPLSDEDLDGVVNLSVTLATQAATAAEGLKYVISGDYLS